MNFISVLLATLAPRARLVMLLSSVLILAIAYVFQYGFGYEPCDLCNYQRKPYYLVIGLMVLALLLERNSAGGLARLSLVLLGLAALSMFVDSGIAVYHVGVEQHWWQGPTACSAGALGEGSVEELLKQVAGSRIVRCDEPAWTLFGISMAGYNVPLTLGLGAFGAYSWKKERSGQISR